MQLLGGMENTTASLVYERGSWGEDFQKFELVLLYQLMKFHA